MKTIINVIVLSASLAASALCAQSDLYGHRKVEVVAHTFVEQVKGAGFLTAAIQTADGGYVSTSTIDSSNIIVRKTTISGKKQWERKLRFDVDGGARINGIAQTTDGGFVFASQVGCDNVLGCSGTLPSAAASIKLRPNGTVAWKKSLTKSDTGFDYRFVSVSATPDGGVLATGRRLLKDFDDSPRLIVAKFTSAGDLVWEKSFATLMDNVFDFRFVIHSIPISDGGLIVAFFVPLSGVEVMKISSAGNVVWAKLVRSSFIFQSIGATSNGGAILIGTNTNSRKLRVVVLKDDGTVNWKAAYSLVVPGFPYFVLSPVQTSDGGFVLTGSIHNGSVNENHGFIAKINSSRKIEFQNTFGSGQSREPVFSTADGGFFLFGAATNPADLLVSKVDSQGSVPGCGSIQPHGASGSGSFGALRLRTLPIIQSEDLSLEPFEFGLSSVASNHRTSNVCQQ